MVSAVSQVNKHAQTINSFSLPCEVMFIQKKMRISVEFPIFQGMNRHAADFAFGYPLMGSINYQISLGKELVVYLREHLNAQNNNSLFH